MELIFFRNLGRLNCIFPWVSLLDSSCFKDGIEHMKLKTISFYSFYPQPRQICMYIHKNKSIFTYGKQLGLSCQMFGLNLIPLSSRQWWEQIKVQLSYCSVVKAKHGVEKLPTSAFSHYQLQPQWIVQPHLVLSRRPVPNLSMPVSNCQLHP